MSLQSYENKLTVEKIIQQKSELYAREELKLSFGFGCNSGNLTLGAKKYPLYFGAMICEGCRKC